MSMAPTKQQVWDDLARIIAAMPENRKNPKMLKAPMDAAHWWTNIIERPNQYDAPRKIHVRDIDQSESWRWPYHENTIHLFKKFSAYPRAHQDTIIAAREDKIFWRGDEMCFFMQVIDETLKMRELGTEKYKKKAVARSKGLMADKTSRG